MIEDRDAASSPEGVDRIAFEMRERGEPFVRATVVRREPPVAADVGDRAVVTPDGEIHGWIGGVACAQSIVEREARTALETGRSKLIGIAPDPESIDRPGLDAHPMTCHSEGVLEVFLDPVSSGEKLLVVGDSPVARALPLLAADHGFDVLVATGTDEDDASTDGTVVSTVDPDELVERFGRIPYVVVASMGSCDARGVAAGVKLDASYVGLVASSDRAESVASRAASLLDSDRTTVSDRVTNPAGVDIHARTPGEIAVSVVAELIAVRNLEGSDETRDVADDHGHAMDEADGSTAIDPVCGMTVDVGAASATVEYGEQPYHFCAPGCAKAFEADPEQYL